jgi:hypothetical protein
MACRSFRALRRLLLIEPKQTTPPYTFNHLIADG